MVRQTSPAKITSIKISEGRKMKKISSFLSLVSEWRKMNNLSNQKQKQDHIFLLTLFFSKKLGTQDPRNIGTFDALKVPMFRGSYVQSFLKKARNIGPSEHRTFGTQDTHPANSLGLTAPCHAAGLPTPCHLTKVASVSPHCMVAQLELCYSHPDNPRSWPTAVGFQIAILL